MSLVNKKKKFCMWCANLKQKPVSTHTVHLQNILTMILLFFLFLQRNTSHCSEHLWACSVHQYSDEKAVCLKQTLPSEQQASHSNIHNPPALAPVCAHMLFPSLKTNKSDMIKQCTTRCVRIYFLNQIYRNSCIYKDEVCEFKMLKYSL